MPTNRRVLTMPARRLRCRNPCKQANMPPMAGLPMFDGPFAEPARPYLLIACVCAAVPLFCLV